MFIFNNYFLILSHSQRNSSRISKNNKFMYETLSSSILTEYIRRHSLLLKTEWIIFTIKWFHIIHKNEARIEYCVTYYCIDSSYIYKKRILFNLIWYLHHIIKVESCFITFMWRYLIDHHKSWKKFKQFKIELQLKPNDGACMDLKTWKY